MPDKNADEIKAMPEASPVGGQASATSGNASDEVNRLLHQLKQPLTAISNYARAGILLIDGGMADAARMKELFEKIDRQSGRTAVFSQDLNVAVAKLVRGEKLE